MKKAIYFLFLIVITLNVSAQKKIKKYGKIELSDIKADYCLLDSSAHSEVIYDYGHTYFKYVENFGLKMYFERHTQIKIYNSGGFDNANIEIPIYQGGAYGDEDIESIKGQTHNLVDGKIVETKLKIRDIYFEKNSDKWNMKKFSLPAVKEGSIIEYKYIISSDFYYELRDWEFQSDIPVRWSEYYVEIPEFYTYNITSKGYEPLHINESSQKADYFIQRYSYQTQGKVKWTVQTKVETNQVDFLTNTYRWAAKNLPALKDESFMLSKKNYLTSMDFELASIRYPNQSRKSFSRTWESINRMLLEHESFGEAMKQSFFIKKTVNEIVNSSSTKEEIISKIFGFVKRNIKWDGYHTIFIDNTLRQAFDDGAGNVAEINLLLTVMLKEAGINAEPVVLSTRQNGMIHPAHPSGTQMNYVIAGVFDPTYTILLDATSPLNNINELPFKCLNGRGRIVSKELSNWVNLHRNDVYKKYSSTNIKIQESGEMIGTSTITLSDYAAYEFRKKYSLDSEINYAEDFTKTNSDFNVDSIKVINIDSLHKPIQKQINYKINPSENLAQFIYCNPIIIDKNEKNPFKLEDRKFPINYGYLITDVKNFTYQIPENYSIDEIPSNLSLVTSDRSMKYIYNIKQIGNVVKISTLFQINKFQYNPEQYKEIKEFYNRIIGKESELMVLIRKN